MTPSIHQRYGDDILIGATATSSPAPMATYDDATLLTHRPGDRVRWPSGTVSIQFDLGAGSPVGSPAGDMQADVLVIPCWNVDGGGSPSIVTLTSSTGMNVEIPVPAMLPSGIPRTTAADLTVLEPDDAKRTASQFTLTVTGNSVDLIMGGAVMLYGPKRAFTTYDWHVGFTKNQRGYVIRHDNEYGTDLVSPLRTKTRQYVLTTICTEAEALDLELWADANYGSGLPGTIWPIPDVYEAFFGRLEDVNAQTIRLGGSDAVEVSLTFTEISKGKPVA
jgi:hypothetical protein